MVATVGAVSAAVAEVVGAPDSGLVAWVAGTAGAVVGAVLPSVLGDVVGLDAVAETAVGVVWVAWPVGVADASATEIPCRDKAAARAARGLAGVAA